MSTFSAFRHRNFRLFFFGQLISVVGTWMQSVAQSWLVYDLTGTCVGNGFQAQMIGVNRITYKDPNGVLVVQEFINIAKGKGSGWVDYHYANPKTGKQDAKTTYVEKFGDVLVACGVYK